MRRIATVGTLAALCAALLASPVSAQGHRRGGPPDVETRLSHLTEKLDLSDEQREQLRPLLEEHDEKLRALLDRARSGEADRASLRGDLSDLQRDLDQKLEALLTEEQMDEFRKFRDEQRQRTRERRAGRGRRPGLGP